MAKKSFKTSFDSLLEPTSESSPVAKKLDKEKNATFVVKIRHIHKIKIIAAMKGIMHKDALSEALEEYITQYEQEFGVIKSPD